MKQTLSLILLLCFNFLAPAQSIRLNPAINIDTLSIRMEYAEDIDSELQDRFEGSVLRAIQEFNQEDRSFIIQLDSSQSTTSLLLQMSSIDYVDKKDNLLWTGVGLVCLAGHVYAISTWGITAPILLFPSTYSKIQIQASESLFLSPAKRNQLFINPFGMYRKKEKQKDKMVKKLEKKLYCLFIQLNKQQAKR